MHPRLTHNRLLFAVACLFLLAHPQPALSQDSALEHAVKAAYLYKFAPFVEWPSPGAEFPAGTFTICVVGDADTGNLLLQVANGQQVNSHPIVVRQFAQINSNPGCSILYAAGSPDDVARDLAAVRGMPVLTVTNGNPTPAASGMISFVLQDGHVRFDIDTAAAASAGLVISSKLLNLAVHVTTRSP